MQNSEKTADPSMEEILAKKPEVIILSSMGSDKITYDRVNWWKRWEILPAVKNNHLYIIEPDLILPGQ